MRSPAAHPLAAMLADAATGRFPPVDGLVEVLPPDASGSVAVVAFTGHACVLADVDPCDPVVAAADGFGGVHAPAVIAHLAGCDGLIGTLDVVLVRPGAGSPRHALPATRAYADHPRVVRARRHRRDVEVVGDERGLVTIGEGLVGRTELSVELTGAPLGTGAGRALILGGLARRPVDELVFAQVSPGNSASLRAFLACGFVPIASEVLIEP